MSILYRSFLVAAVMALLLVLASTAQAAHVRPSCFQIRFTFLNFPSYPSTLATYSIFPDGARKVNREQFVFRGDAGGFYQKQIHYCAPLRKVDSHKIRVTGSWKAYVPCPGCREIISFRRQP